MLLYALGAYEAYRLLYQVKTVRLSIVQPRSFRWYIRMGMHLG